MTQDKRSQSESLDDLLAQSAQDDPHVPEALLRRVLADADRVQPMPKLQVRRGLADRVLEALGGWPALGGLAAASCVGFWIGINPPELVGDPAALLWDAQTLNNDSTSDAFSDFGWQWDEG